MDKDILIKLAEAWAAHAGLKLSTVSTYAANDGKFFCNLKKGSGCTLKTTSRLLQWFSDNWDDEAIEWPEGIPRPPKSDKQKEVA